MEGPREIHLAEEWAGLGRALGVIVRRPFLVILGTLACGVAAILLAASRSPSQRSTVSLQLGDKRGANPLQERLQTPTGIVDVAEAMPLLTSDAVLAEVVRAPVDGKLSTPEHPERPVHLGLTTWVEDADASPLAAWVQRVTGDRSPDFRLLASARRTRPDALPHVELQFEDSNTITLSNARETRTLEFTRGEALLFDGLAIHLDPRGRIDSRLWTIDLLNREQAIQRLRRRISTSTPDDKSGVVRVQVDGSDPARTAEIAAAIAHAFLDRDAAQIEKRTTATADQVGARLAQQRAALAKVENEVARIRSANPDVLNPERSAQLLGEARLALEAELRAARALEEDLFETVRRLEAGELAQASRLGSGIDDVRIVKLLETITSFEDQRGRVGSLERSGYADALQTEADSATRERRLLEIEAARLAELARRFRSGDDAALGALGDALSAEGASPTETLTQLYVNDFSATSQELITLRATYTDEWWEVGDAEARLTSLRGHILSHLETKADLIRADVQAARAWEQALASKRDRRPRDVADAANTALDDLWQRLTAAFAARLEGASAQRARVEDGLRDVLARLMRLPQDELRIAEPMLQRKSLAATVTELASVHGAALLAATHATSSASLLVPPAGRGLRTGPRLGFSALVGLVFGLLLTFGIATVTEGAGPQGGVAAGGSMGTGLPLLGEIPRRSADDLSPALLLDPGGPESAALRATRGRIDLAVASGPPLCHLGVRAMDSGGGASTVATGLALAWAEAGLRTLVIDAAGGGLTAQLGLRPTRTWDDFLSDPGDLESIATGAGHPLLRVLAATSPSSAAPLNRRHLQALSEHYDRVLIDLPSLTEDSWDPASSQLDGLLLVHGSSDIPTGQSLPAILRLERAGVHLIGMVRTCRGQETRGKRRRA